MVYRLGTSMDEAGRAVDWSGLLVLTLYGILFLLGGAGLLNPAPIDAQAVTLTNVFQQHYRYGYPLGSQDCPSGYNMPSGQYSSAYHLERGHAIHHSDPKNATNDYWVYWAHFESSDYGVAEVAIFKSTSECGPYILQTNLYPNYNTDGLGYGFRPAGWESRDENIFEDNNQTYNADGTVSTYASAYLITASNSINTVTSSSGSTCGYANDSIAIFKMTADYLGIDATTNPSTKGANWAFVCDQREAPVMFKSGSKYFLITSQAAGWYPSQGAYGSSDNPLTGWTPDPLKLGNTSTFGGQTSDGFVIHGTSADTYVLSFDHLGGADSKNPASGEKTDTGGMWLPVILDGTTGTAKLDWYPSWTVDNTTGILTLPTLKNLATGGSAAATVASNSSSPTSYAIDGNYTTGWAGSSTGSSSFNAAKSTTSTLCPVTAATPLTTCNPSLVVDLGAVYPVQEIDLSQYMINGSESYFTYKIAYSSDDSNWTTLDYTTFNSASNATTLNISSVPFSNNITYGFNFLPVNFSARYVALEQVSSIEQNQNATTTIYGPGLFEMAVIESTAPPTPEPVTVSVTPSSSNVNTDSSFTVAVSVTGPNGFATPTGYIQLTAPGYVSETYGLVGGAASFTVPAGALTGGTGSATASYRPDPTSAPVYGIGTTTGSSQVYVGTPDAPVNLTITQVSPGALQVSWTASVGAASYVISRSSNGGNIYTPVGTQASTSYVDTGLSNNGTQYCYSVAAVNGAGTGTATAPVCSTASDNFPVTGITVNPSGPDTITIAYTAVANVTGYLIKASVNSSPFSALPTAASTTTTTLTSFTNAGLTVGNAYCYTVAAVFSTGTAADSSPVCNTATTGSAPTSITVTPTADAQLTVAWTSGNSTATSYQINRSVNGGAFSTLVASQTALTYADTGLTDYTTVYCYTVNASLNGVVGPTSVAACNTPIFFLTISNFSFEAPATTTYNYGPAAAAWNFTASTTATVSGIAGVAAGSGVTTNGSAFTASNSLAPDGTQVAFIQGPGSISQAIGGFTAGQTYMITVATSQRQNKSGGQLGNTFDVSVNGTAVGSIAPVQAVKPYVDYSATFAATATSNTIAFVGSDLRISSSSKDNTVFLDNVRINPVRTGATTITPQSTTAIYGDSAITLAATSTFTSGTQPTGMLIFQVGSGDQMPGACTIQGNVQSCTVSYPVSELTVGGNTLTVSYLGDANYAAASATVSVTLNPATLTITPDAGKISVYGSGYSSFSGTVTGLKNGDTGTAVYASAGSAATANAGVYDITSSFVFTSGNAANYSIVARTATGGLTVTAAALVITANSVSRVYGTANPTFTGTVTGAINGDIFTESFATSASAASNVGTYAIVPSLTGARLADYTQKTIDGVLTITKATPAMTIVSSSVPVLLLDPVTFTATLSASAGNPSERMSFLDGITLLGTGTISNGVATFTTSALALGSHSISAVYSGDTNFGSASSGLLLQGVIDINLGTPASGSTSLTAPPGGSASYLLAIAPSSGTTFPAAIVLTVSGLPPGASAILTPDGWTRTSSNAWMLPANTTISGNTQLTIALASLAQVEMSPDRNLGYRKSPLALAVLLLPFLGCVRRSGKRIFPVLLLLAGMLAAGVGFTGCGSAAGVPAQTEKTYPLTVTVASGALSHSTNLQITVE